MINVSSGLDDVDTRLITELRRRPRASLTDIAAAAGVARGTAYSRLDRLRDSGVITGFGPDLDPKASGYPVTAFCTLEIRQGSHDATVAALGAIDEVIEIFTVTGVGDLLCKVVARSNDDLHDILLRMTAVKSVERSQTQLALQNSHTRHLADLIVSTTT